MRDFEQQEKAWFICSSAIFYFRYMHTMNTRVSCVLSEPPEWHAGFVVLSEIDGLLPAKSSTSPLPVAKKEAARCLHTNNRLPHYSVLAIEKPGHVYVFLIAQ